MDYNKKGGNKMINTQELTSIFLNEVKRKGKRPLEEFDEVLLKQLKALKEGIEIGNELQYPEVTKELVILPNKEKGEILYSLLIGIVNEDKYSGTILENEFIVQFYLGVIKTLIGNQKINVANITSGAGNLISKISSKLSVNEAHSYELMDTFVSIQRKIMTITGLNVQVIQKDVIRENVPESLVDLTVFSPPFGQRINEELDTEQSYLLKGLKKVRDAELVYLDRAFKMTKPGGYIVTILPIGLLNKMTVQPVRDSILDQAYMKAIINMPTNVFANTGVATSMLVMQKKEEALQEPKDVIMADLSTIRLEHKKLNHPSDINEYNEILRLLSLQGER